MEGNPKVFRDTDNPLVRRFLLGEASEEELQSINVKADDSH